MGVSQGGVEEQLTDGAVDPAAASPDGAVPDGVTAPPIAISLRPSGDIDVDLRPPDQLALPLSGLLAAPRWKLAVKRAMDVVVASIMLVTLSPVLLLVVLGVRLTSRGPVLFHQERIGKDGKPFTFLKFRSMYANAELRLVEVLPDNEVTGPVFKIRDDPRVTPVGRFLRRSSLDELPQLLNILRGDMSLVGPRPPLPHEVATYSAREARRLRVKPGITCIWQVSGRSNLGFDAWVDLDLKYIDDWGLLMDLKLLLLTIPAVISGRGAY